MSIKTKIALIIGAVVFLISLLAAVKYQHDLLQKQNDTLTEMKELKDNWVRGQTQVVTKKELEDLGFVDYFYEGVIFSDARKVPFVRR